MALGDGRCHVEKEELMEKMEELLACSMSIFGVDERV